jgi:hypothetical protein
MASLRRKFTGGPALRIRLPVSLQQQLPALLQQDRIPPALSGAERVALGGGKGLATVQSHMHQVLLASAGDDILHFFVAQPRVGLRVGAGLLPLRPGQHLIPGLEFADGLEFGLPRLGRAGRRSRRPHLHRGLGRETVQTRREARELAELAARIGNGERAQQTIQAAILGVAAPIDFAT